MTPFALTVRYNRLLRALPADELNPLISFLEPVTLTAGANLYRLDESARYVYFPEDCLVSWITTFKNGTSVEQGSVGREGVVGAELYLSAVELNREARVRIGGQALKMKTERFLLLLKSESALKRLVREYLSVYIDQTLQIGSCNTAHCLDERLARLLLTYHRLTGHSRLKLTHDGIAQMLGTYRSPVSRAASELKDQKIIDYSRGTISIIDEQKLSEQACECYEGIKNRYQAYDLFLSRQVAGPESAGTTRFLNAGDRHR